MDRTIIAHSPTEMEAIGIEIADTLRDGMIVSLLGPLGAGKTTLVKGIAKGLLITDVVISPSYLLARDYHGRLLLHHLDAYRIDSLDEFAEVGLDELLPPQQGVSVVEWADRVESLIDVSDTLVKIEPLANRDRRVRVTTG